MWTKNIRDFKTMLCGQETEIIWVSENQSFTENFVRDNNELLT